MRKSIGGNLGMDAWRTLHQMDKALEVALAQTDGPNIRYEGAVAVCGWCGFALIVAGPRECCEKGREFDAKAAGK
jgi:hypothetical protein